MINKKNNRLRRCRKFRYNIKYKYMNKYRLVVYKTSKHIYAQIIIFRDNKSFVILTSSTLEKYFKNLKICNISSAKIVGKNIANKCLKKNIYNVIFDKSGFKYHGRIKALADSARKYGLLF